MRNYTDMLMVYENTVLLLAWHFKHGVYYGLTQLATSGNHNWSLGNIPHTTAWECCVINCPYLSLQGRKHFHSDHCCQKWQSKGIILPMKVATVGCYAGCKHYINSTAQNHLLYQHTNYYYKILLPAFHYHFNLQSFIPAILCKFTIW